MLDFLSYYKYTQSPPPPPFRLEYKAISFIMASAHTCCYKALLLIPQRQTTDPPNV